MNQALWIFRKDVRFLRLEIALLAAINAAYAFAAPLELFVYAAAVLFIARLVHAETLPGDRQFWITRPYRRASLFAAKLLSIAVFVSLPCLIAKMRLLSAAGFPATEVAPGLLWGELLMLAGVWLPTAALAAVTPGLIQFLLAAFALAAASFGLRIATSMPRPAFRNVLEAFQWVGDAMSLLAAASAAAVILFLQYRGRRTTLSRAVGVAGIAGFSLLFLLTPWQVMLAVQTRLSREPQAPPGISIVVDRGYLRILPLGGWDGVQTDLPMRIEGFPADREMRAEAVEITLTAPDGSEFSPSRLPVLVPRSIRGALVYNANFAVSREFFRRHAGRPLKLRASLHGTVFGNPREKTIPLSTTPVEAVDGLRCAMGVFHQLHCRAALRWPERIVSVRFPGVPPVSMTRMLSYSPFPTGVGADLIESRWITAPLSAREGTVVSLEPVSHFRRDFEVLSFDLAQFANAKP